MMSIHLGTTLFVLLATSQQALAHYWTIPSTTPAPMKAEASIDQDGVKGTFTFTQWGGNAPTLMEYDLQGLKGNNNMYHVHVKPVPQHDPEQVRNDPAAIAKLCADPATGGHLNPFGITAKIPPRSAPQDQYEVGDLSGKHGPLQLVGDDHYKGSSVDQMLPLSGENSIIGRSVVIHKTDGKRWVCATITRSVTN